jgi:hypothetical protein
MFHAAHVARIKTVTRRHIPGLDAKSIDKFAMSAALQRIVAILHTGMVVDFGPPAHLPGEIKPMVTSWAVNNAFDHMKPLDIGQVITPKPENIWFNDGTPKPYWAGKTRPGRFLPKSLYSLAPQVRIRSARPEPLLDITEPDALLEGIRMFNTPHEGPSSAGYSWTQNDRRWVLPCTAYFDLWDSLHGPKHASTNPIVWRYEFEPCS